MLSIFKAASTGFELLIKGGLIDLLMLGSTFYYAVAAVA